MALGRQASSLPVNRLGHQNGGLALDFMACNRLVTLYDGSFPRNPCQ